MSDTNSGSINPIVPAMKQNFIKDLQDCPHVLKPEDEAKYALGFAAGVRYLSDLMKPDTDALDAIIKKWDK